MENELNSEEKINKIVANIHEQIQPALYEYNPHNEEKNVEMEADLNAKILKSTMTINEKYPELSKYIDEMPITIPDEKHPEITIQNLCSYLNTLNNVLNKYVKEHPKK
ncbi:MAG: hypothetical protein V4667_01515 [Bacteroidota bacterium]